MSTSAGRSKPLSMSRATTRAASVSATANEVSMSAKRASALGAHSRRVDSSASLCAAATTSSSAMSLIILASSSASSAVAPPHARAAASRSVATPAFPAFEASTYADIPTALRARVSAGPVCFRSFEEPQQLGGVSSSATTSALPLMAAIMSASLPCAFCTRGSAPRSKSKRTTAAASGPDGALLPILRASSSFFGCGAVHATSSAVHPPSSGASMAARSNAPTPPGALRTACTAVTSPLPHAYIRGVLPPFSYRCRGSAPA